MFPQVGNHSSTRFQYKQSAFRRSRRGILDKFRSWMRRQLPPLNPRQVGGYAALQAERLAGKHRLAVALEAHALRWKDDRTALAAHRIRAVVIAVVCNFGAGRLPHSSPFSGTLINSSALAQHASL